MGSGRSSNTTRNCTTRFKLCSLLGSGGVRSCSRMDQVLLTSTQVCADVLQTMSAPHTRLSPGDHRGEVLYPDSSCQLTWATSRRLCGQPCSLSSPTFSYTAAFFIMQTSCKFSAGRPRAEDSASRRSSEALLCDHSSFPTHRPSLQHLRRGSTSR